MGLAPLLVVLKTLALTQSLVATVYVRPSVLDNFRAHWPVTFIPLIVVAAILAIPWFVRQGRERLTFVSSALFLAAMLAGAAAALYPSLLPASGDSLY